MKKHIALAATVLLALALAAIASASTSTSGSTTVTGTGPYAWHLVSSEADPYSTVDWAPDSALQVSDLTGLSARITTVAGSCGGGSPRFSIELADGKNLFVYFGQAPNFTSCNDGNTGNLLKQGARIDATQEGGPFYADWSYVKANYGSKAIDDISLVVDGGWSQEGGEQAFDVSRIRIHGKHGLNEVLTPAPPVITDESFGQVDRIAACASQPVLRVGDGSMGIFVDLDQATFDSGVYAGVTFTPAIYAVGVGLTCDVPAGFKATGRKVGELDDPSPDAPYAEYAA